MGASGDMNMHSLWLAVGWLGVVAALVFSLGPATPQGPGHHADKLVHFAGYAMLIYWWAQLYVTFPQRVRVGAALLMLGIVIEWLQGFTPSRELDVWDVLANTTGILFGGWIAYRSANLLQLCARYTPNPRGK